MIKFEIDREHHIQQLECVGGPVELAVEIGLMIQAIYAETSSINPIAGGMLKTLFQAGMTDDSPVWRIDKGHEVNPESKVITMIRPWHDDGQAL